jgi:serine/threonine-protein kinase ATR
MKPGQKRVGSKKKTLSHFFESHILGIIAHFSDVLDNHHETHPVSERKRCVGAIGEMINLAMNHVTIALPQVSSVRTFIFYLRLLITV